jgi:hypothetical protein
VEFVKLADLPGLGFTEKLGQLAMAGFPTPAATWEPSPTSACEPHGAIRLRRKGQRIRLIHPVSTENRPLAQLPEVTTAVTARLDDLRDLVTDQLAVPRPALRRGAPAGGSGITRRSRETAPDRTGFG